MKLILAYTKGGKELADSIKKYIESLNKVELTEIENDDVFELSQKTAKFVLEAPSENRAIIIDDFGIAPFIVTAKHKNIITSETNDEHTAYMTRDHNNANVVTLGYELIGEKVALSITDRFINHDYAGGRHQIRIDMLNKM